MSRFKCSCSRRDFLKKGLYGIGVGATLPLLVDRTSAALAAQAFTGTSMETSPERILVVVELSGGNDGLNTVVPYGNDEYYRVRPNLGIPESQVLKIEDGYGFHPSLVGFERLYKEGNGSRSWVWIRQPKPVPFFFHGLLAHRSSQWRRNTWVGW